MNKRQRAQVAREWNKRLTAIEKLYAPRVFRALKSQIDGVISDIQTYGIEFAKRRLSSLSFNSQMTDAIRTMHRNIGVAQARRTLAALKREPMVRKSLFVSDDGRLEEKAAIGFAPEWIEQILEYFRLHLLQSVTTISDTSRDWILRRMSEGQEKGWGVNEIVASINNRDYMGYRAELIVRTEGTRAANYGVTIGAEKYDYEVDKEWISIPDNRRRHSHRLVDGQLRPMDERFSNGLLFPGDPEGSAKEVCNCRCTEAIIPRRDADGRLISKFKPAITLPGTIPTRQTITI